MIDTIINWIVSIDWLFVGKIYNLIGLLTLFFLIQSWKKNNDYDGLEQAMPKMILMAILLWPVVVVVIVLSWPVFTWGFWLRPIPTLSFDAYLSFLFKQL